MLMCENQTFATSCVCLVTQLCPTLCDPMDCMQPTRFLRPWGFPGKNTGVGCHFLLQGIFLTQGSNQHLLCLLYHKQILYPLSHHGSPCYFKSLKFGNYL